MDLRNFGTRYWLYIIVLFFILWHWKGSVSSDSFLSWLGVFGLLYAYGQTILAYKVYLDSRDDTELLREIRDLLKQRS
jgi:hypothetical protein